jgi:hypothetical protein
MNEEWVIHNIPCKPLKLTTSQLAVNVVMLLGLARLVEPIHGSKEFLKCVTVVHLNTASLH